MSPRFGVLAALLLTAVLGVAILAASNQPAAAQEPDRQAPERLATAQAVPSTEWRGDVNCSGNTDIIDALLVSLYTVDLRSGTSACPVDTASEINLAEADLDGDASVTIVDALLIARCDLLIDIDPCLPLLPSEPLTPANDEVVNATVIVPLPSGAHVPALGAGYQASYGPGESADTCHAPNDGGGSTWYRVETPGHRLSVLGDTFFSTVEVAIFEAQPGVTEPADVTDLQLLICGNNSHDVTVMTEPGETYWVSYSDTNSDLWLLFDGYNPCAANASGEVQCRGPANDDIRNAAAIDPPALGETVFVSNEGLRRESGGQNHWTFHSDEVAAFPELGDRARSLYCTRTSRGDGTAWYRIVATGEVLEIDGADDQAMSFYTMNEQPDTAGGVSPARSLSDLTLVECAEQEWHPRVQTIPGETYYIVAYNGGDQPFEVSSLSVIPNDEIATAQTISLSPTGTLIEAQPDNYRATFDDAENVDNCHRGNRRQTGSAWYRFEVTSGPTHVHIDGARGRRGIYAAAPGVTEPLTMSDLVLLDCASYSPTSTILQAGQTYWLSLNDITVDTWVFAEDPHESSTG